MIAWLSKYLVAGAGVLCVILAGLAGYYKVTGDMARANLKTANVKIELLQDANNKFVISTEKQNLAIDAWQKAAEARQANAAELVKQAAVVAKPHQQKASRIAGVVLVGDECKDLQRVVDEARAR